MEQSARKFLLSAKTLIRLKRFAFNAIEGTILTTQENVPGLSVLIDKYLLKEVIIVSRFLLFVGDTIRLMGIVLTAKIKVTPLLRDNVDNSLFLSLDVKKDSDWVSEPALVPN